MALLLLGLGLALGLALVSAPPLDLETIVQGNYNMAKVTGTWYSIFMASDNLTRVQDNGDLHIFMRNIEHLRNGNLQFTFMFKVQGECVHVTVVCEKTAKNGVYTISYEGHNKLRVSETSYDLYIIFYLQNIRNGKQTQVLALYGRVPELGSPFLQRFEKTCRQYGVDPQNIINLSGTDRC